MIWIVAELYGWEMARAKQRLIHSLRHNLVPIKKIKLLWLAVILLKPRSKGQTRKLNFVTENRSAKDQRHID